MKKLVLAFAVSGLAVAPSMVFASNPILSSLKQQGVEAQVLADHELSEIKGAALNGTYFSFFGCPDLRIVWRAQVRFCVISG